MATIAVFNNNNTDHYTNLHIYTDVGTTEHIYNSLKRDKSPHKQVAISWWPINRKLIFKSSKVVLVAALIAILVLVACGLTIGYFIGKNVCENRSRKQLNLSDDSYLRKTTQMLNVSDNYSTLNDGKEATVSSTSKMKALTTEIPTRSIQTTVMTRRTTKQSPSIKVNLEGKAFMILAKENDQFWHFDGGHRILKVLSSLWQPDDNFVKFTFEKQTDGSYKIKSVAIPRYMYDGYGVPGARGIYLNGDDQTDDDHMRYYITMETHGYYRIKTKATNRYVRLDPDKYVSSRFNKADDRSLFKLVQV